MSPQTYVYAAASLIMIVAVCFIAAAWISDRIKRLMRDHPAAACQHYPTARCKWPACSCGFDKPKTGEGS